MATPLKTSQMPPDGFYPRDALPAPLSAWVHPRKPEHIGVDVINGQPRTRVAGAEVQEKKASSPIPEPPSPGVTVGWRVKTPSAQNYGELIRVEMYPVREYHDVLIPSAAVLDTYTLKQLRDVAKRTVGFHDKHLQMVRRKKDVRRLIEWGREHLEAYWLWKAVQPDE